MRIEVIADADRGAAVAAEAVLESLDEARACGRRPVLGVATGSSPVAVYRELAGRLAREQAHGDDLTVFALDEYVGLHAADPHSFAAFVRDHVTTQLRLNPDAVHVPPGTAEDFVGACRRYEDSIRRAGGVDVQIAGIGANGHIAFNEPGSPFDSRTRVVALSERTRADNSRFFDKPGRVPRRAVTQGIGTILQARRIVVVARGDAKAAAVRAAIEGPVTPDCPASALQRHGDVLWVLDQAAAAGLHDVVPS